MSFKNNFKERFPYAQHQQLLDRPAFARSVDLDRYRAAFPDRWSSFLRNQFRSVTEVAAFFGVTERAARNWWEGSCHKPSGHTVALAAVAFPQDFSEMMRKVA